MRFDYDPPSKILLVAPGDWRLIFYDGSIQQVNVIPIGETPLGFLLNEEVKLAGDVTVQAAQERAGEVDVTLVRTEEPDQGKVVLTLAKDPMRLSHWSVTDAQGLTTIIILPIRRPAWSSTAAIRLARPQAVRLSQGLSGPRRRFAPRAVGHRSYGLAATS